VALQRLQDQQQQQQQGKVLRGVAQLLLHPSGSISGHFVGAPGSSGGELQQQQQQVCLGLQGRQVLGIHSCYRDPEWALLQMSVIKYSSNHGTRSGNTGSGCVGVGNSSSRAEAEQQMSGVDMKQQQDLQQHAAKRQRMEHQSTESQHQQQQRDGTPGLPGDGGGAAADSEAQYIALGAAAAAAAVVPDGRPNEPVFEAEAWVQRSGGDLVALEPANMEDEDTEAAIMQVRLLHISLVHGCEYEFGDLVALEPADMEDEDTEAAVMQVGSTLVKSVCYVPVSKVHACSSGCCDWTAAPT
jgi:hypothetical protein